MTDRPLTLLRALATRYPGAWAQFDEMRADRGRGLPDWPAWCWCPLAGAFAIVSQGRAINPALVGDVPALGALAAWRPGQGIYRFDPDLYRAILETDLSQAVPWDHLYQLPEWALYLETPGLTWSGRRVHGAWAHLEADANDGRQELRLLLDLTMGPVPVPLHLIPGGSIQTALDAMAFEAAAQSARHGLSLPPDGLSLPPADMATLRALVSLLLYLCAANAGFPGGARPTQAQPTRTRKGLKSFPPDHPRVWMIGETIGQAMRQALEATEGTHAGPRPHMRRAHWHSYWMGPKDTPAARRLELRWLLPMLVGDVRMS